MTNYLTPLGILICKPSERLFFMSLLKEFVFEIAWHLHEQLYAKGSKLAIKS